MQFDAAGFDTGRYPYRLMVTNNYSLSSVSSTVLGTVLVNNEAASRFGAGWTLDGLARRRLVYGVYSRISKPALRSIR